MGFGLGGLGWGLRGGLGLGGLGGFRRICAEYLQVPTAAHLEGVAPLRITLAKSYQAHLTSKEWDPEAYTLEVTELRV